MDPESLTASGAVVIGGLVGIAILLAGSFPKILGPVEGYLRERAAKRREAAIALDEFDMRDLKSQVVYLSERVRQMDTRERRWRKQTDEHEVWDYLAVQTIRAEINPAHPSPPPLMTPDPIPEEETP